MLAAALAVLSFHTNFEGGSLGKVETVADNHFRCHVAGQADQAGRNRQASWYYFRVDHARNRTITFDMVDLAGEYNFKPNRGAITKDTPPFYSFDQKTWLPVEESEYEEAAPRLTFRIHATADRVWIAHVPPYTNNDLQALLKAAARNPSAAIVSIGKTFQGRDIPLLTITDHGSSAAKKTIWLMFRQHAWEAGSSWTGDGLIRFAVSADPIAVEIRRTTVLKILPMCDPDGVARGTVRFNVKGFDLNRNWDITDPVNMPEITAERRAVLDWLDKGNRIDLFMTLHNTETTESAQGPPQATAATQPVFERFIESFSAGTTFAPSVKLYYAQPSTDTQTAGRMTALQGLYRDRQLPAIEIEMRIARHPKLGHRPNIDDRRRAGVELLQALWKAVSEN